RAAVEPAHRTAGDFAQDVHRPHVGFHVPGERVVRGVHAERVVVAVHGHVGVAAQRLAPRLAGTAAAGEEIDDDFSRTQGAGERLAGEVETGLAGAVSHGCFLLPWFPPADPRTTACVPREACGGRGGWSGW